MKTAEAVSTFPTIDEVSNIDILSSPFFQPDDEFIKWLIKYANGRIIVDVGCGSGYICALIMKNGGRCIGVEPNWTTERKIFWVERGYDFNVLPQKAQTSMITSLPADRTLLIFARPCHSNFAFETIQKAKANGIESLYIGKQQNAICDLSPLKFKKLPHVGTSKEDEIVLSIK